MQAVLTPPDLSALAEPEPEEEPEDEDDFPRTRKRRSTTSSSAKRSSIISNEDLRDMKSGEAKNLAEDLSLCITLLMLFDFDGDTLVRQDDWKRGTKHMSLSDMGEDEALWALLVRKFGSQQPNTVSVPRAMQAMRLGPEGTMSMFKLLFSSVSTTATKVEQAEMKLRQTQGIMAQRAALIWKRRLIEPVLSAWIDLYVTGRDKRRAAVRHIFVRQMRASLERWQAECAAKRRTERRVRAAQRRGLTDSFERWASGYLGYSAAFKAWVALRDDMRRHRQVLGRHARIIRRAVRRDVRRAFDTWDAAREAKLQMRRVERRARRLPLASAFDLWLSNCDAEREQAAREASKRGKMAKFLRRLMQKGLGGAWNQWAALVAERERLRGYMRRVLHRGLVAALHHWMALREERARMKRVCRRLKSPGLGRAWTAWLDLVDARRRLAVHANRFFGRDLPKAWNSWVEVALAARERGDRMGKAGRRLMNRELGAAWQHWLGQWAETRRLRRFMKRALQAGLAAAWESWRELCEQMQRLQRVARRAANSGLARGWAGWLTFIEGLEQGQETLERLARFARRVRNRGVSLAWNAWVVLCEEVGRLRAFMRRALQQGLVQALARWGQLCSERSRMLQFGARLANVGLARAWGAWIDAADSHRRLAAHASRFANQAALCAFNRWVEAADESARAREAMGRAVSRLLNRELGRAWERWCDAHESEGGLRQFARRMLCAGAVRGLRQWREVARELRRMRRFLVKGLRQSLSRAWNEWEAKAAERRRKVELIRKVANRMANALLDRAFDAWVAEVDRRISRRNQLYASAVNRLRMRASTIVFEAWASVVGGAARRDALIVPVLRKLMHRQLAVALAAWVGFMAVRTDLRRRFARRIVHALLSRCFEAWAEGTADEHEKKRKVKKMAARMQRSLEVRVLTAWHRYVVHSRELLARAAAMWGGTATTVRALSTWRQFASARRRFFELARKMMGRYTQQLLAKCFLAWHARVRADRAAREERRRSAMAMLSGNEGLLLEIRFKEWRRKVQDLVAERARLAAKFFGRYIHQLAAKTFLAWAAHAARTAAARHEAQRATLRRVFDALRSEVIEARALHHLTSPQCQAVTPPAEEPSQPPTPPVVMYSRPPPMQWPVTPVRPQGPLEALGAQLDAQLELANFHQVAAVLLGANDALAAAAATLYDTSAMTGGGSIGGGSGGSSGGVVAGRSRAAAEAAAMTNRAAEDDALDATDAEEVAEGMEAEEAAEGEADAASLEFERRATHERMGLLLGQLRLVGASLRRSERLLAPLPAVAVDHAAYAMLKADVDSLGEQLGATQRALADMQAAKAAKYELSFMRDELHSFLFGREAREALADGRAASLLPSAAPEKLLALPASAGARALVSLPPSEYARSEFDTFDVRSEYGYASGGGMLDEAMLAVHGASQPPPPFQHPLQPPQQLPALAPQPSGAPASQLPSRVPSRPASAASRAPLTSRPASAAPSRPTTRPASARGQRTPVAVEPPPGVPYAVVAAAEIADLNQLLPELRAADGSRRTAGRAKAAPPPQPAAPAQRRPQSAGQSPRLRSLVEAEPAHAVGAGEYYDERAEYEALFAESG